MQYLLTFDIDTHEDHFLRVENPIGELKKLEEFITSNGMILKYNFGYLVSPNVSFVDLFLTFQNTLKKFEWLSYCIKNAKIIRIDEIMDLSPIIDKYRKECSD